jgi:hypothetical protein
LRVPIRIRIATKYAPSRPVAAINYGDQSRAGT